MALPGPARPSRESVNNGSMRSVGQRHRLLVAVASSERSIMCSLPTKTPHRQQASSTVVAVQLNMYQFDLFHVIPTANINARYDITTTVLIFLLRYIIDTCLREASFSVHRVRERSQHVTLLQSYRIAKCYRFVRTCSMFYKLFYIT